MTSQKTPAARAAATKPGAFDRSDEADAPLVGASDLEKIALLSALGAASWAAPERLWAPLCRALARVTTRVSARRMHWLTENLPDALVRRLDAATPRAACTHFEAADFQETMLVLRCYRPRGRRPAVRLVGREHLDAALDGGRGAILWVTDFASASLVTKIATHEAGFAVSHLSRPTHGFSKTRFGMRVLNPLRTRVEDRYLEERVTIRDGNTAGALRTLRHRLRANGVVSITVSNAALRVVQTPFLGGSLALATGPLNLALSAGAPLLPVFTERIAAGAFEVQVAAPFDLRDSMPRDRAFAAAAERYVKLLAPYVARRPAHWRGWRAGWSASRPA